MLNSSEQHKEEVAALVLRLRDLTIPDMALDAEILRVFGISTESYTEGPAIARARSHLTGSLDDLLAFTDLALPHLRVIIGEMGDPIPHEAAPAKYWCRVRHWRDGDFWSEYTAVGCTRPLTALFSILTLHLMLISATAPAEGSRG